MAAGMGSRYGGLKQLDKVGPNGETIIDYSLHDAIQAGFTKVIFIIRRDFEDQFKLQITNKYLGKFTVEFAFQDIDDLPNGFSCPNGREKPWGTGQAILCARNLINEPFVVINGDDYYGQESFKVIADYYNNGGVQFSMVAFRLDKTLSDFGPVTRGVCNVENDKLDTVVETENLKKKDNYISTNRNITLDGSEPVSMNMWGFTPSLFNYLHEDFEEVIKHKMNNNGVDVVLEVVGGDVFKKSMKLLNPFGRTVVAGFASLNLKKMNPISWVNTWKDIPRAKVADLAESSTGLLATHLGYLLNSGSLLREVWDELVTFTIKHGIKPIIGHRFEFDDLSKAHELMESRNSYGKIIISLPTAL